MNYTLHQLQIFLKVCELGSITKASEEMFLTQPAVSIQLKKLQDQFDIPLTELIGRKIYVTDFGKEIAKVSEEIIEASKKIHHTALQFQGLLAGEIKFSIVSTAKYILPYFMNGFVKQHSAIDISIDVTNKTKVVESLIKNESDFALVSVLPENLEIEKITLMSNQLYLVKGAEEDATSKSISNKQLGQLPMIFREKGSATRKAMEDYFRKSNVIPNSKLVLVSNEAIKQAVCAGLGYSIMPLIGMMDELETGKMNIVEAKGLPMSTSWNLIYNKNKVLSPAAQAYIRYIEETKESTIAKYFDFK